MQNLRAMQIVVDDEQECPIACDLAQGPLGEIVELRRVGELKEERAELARLGQRSYTREDLRCLLVLGDRLQRLKVLNPFAEHQRSCNGAASSAGTAPAASRASASSSSSCSL